MGGATLDDLGHIDAVVSRNVLVSNTTSNTEAKACRQVIVRLPAAEPFHWFFKEQQGYVEAMETFITRL